MKSARPVQPEPAKGTRVKLHPSLAGRSYQEAGSGVTDCRGCLGGVWACLLSETVVERLPEGRRWRLWTSHRSCHNWVSEEAQSEAHWRKQE